MSTHFHDKLCSGNSTFIRNNFAVLSLNLTVRKIFNCFWNDIKAVKKVAVNQAFLQAHLIGDLFVQYAGCPGYCRTNQDALTIAPEEVASKIEEDNWRELKVNNK